MKTHHALKQVIPLYLLSSSLLLASLGVISVISSSQVSGSPFFSVPLCPGRRLQPAGCRREDACPYLPPYFVFYSGVVRLMKALGVQLLRTGSVSSRALRARYICVNFTPTPRGRVAISSLLFLLLALPPPGAFGVSLSEKKTSAAGATNLFPLPWKSSGRLGLLY